jgi:hypothetical protein
LCLGGKTAPPCAPAVSHSGATTKLSGALIPAVGTARRRNRLLVLAASGGIYSFGNAPFYGSLDGQSYFNGQGGASSMAVTSDGGGYWVLSVDGSVYTFGDAPYLGGGLRFTLRIRQLWKQQG